jgi:3-oxoadipate enol-lactonase
MNFLIANGIRLGYRLDGPDNAPPLVLLNSLGTDLRIWNPQVALLSRTLRVIRYDQRGHGASEVPAGPYTIEQLGLDLLALLDALQIERAHLCGLSLGGMVALWCAAHHPGRVARAVFANTAARIGTMESWNARIALVNTGGMSAIREMVVARFLSEGFRRSHPEVARQLGEMLEAIDPAGYMGACAALRDADLHEIVAAIQVPSLIIAGELDEATPPAQVQELHAAISGSELLLLREAAHLSNVEQPEAFSKAVLAFLASAERPI